jgi:hypothetical protein
LAFLPGLVDERADEAGTDAAALMTGADFGTGEADLGGAVSDVEHAAACSGRSIRTPLLKTAPARTRAARWGALTDRR